MSTPSVSVDALEKRYGDVRALDGVSFEVNEGEIFGLVGPNGAGKSTTLRTLATLLHTDGGTVTVCGHDVETAAHEVRESIRYLPDEAGAYESLSGRKNLRFVADFFGDGEDYLERGVEIADLGERIDDAAGEYSKGMTRKLLLASTLMTEPDLAILDEPTSGLDVRNSRQVREIIEAYPSGNRAVLLSSHNMLEVEYLCDRVGLLNDGHIVAEGTPDELLERYGVENLEDVFMEVVS